jgi:hypothetical protein
MADDNMKKSEGMIPKTTFKVKFEEWKCRIQAGEKRMKQYHGQWQKYVQQSVRSYQDIGVETFGTNWMYPEARNAVANIYVNDPEWQLINHNPEFQKSKRAGESILSHVWSKLQWATPIRNMLYDAWYFGVGPVKLTFTNPNQGLDNLDLNPERMAAVQQMLSSMGLSNINEEDVTRIMSGFGFTVNYNQTELRGYPALHNVPIKNFFIDPMTDQISIDKCQFIGEKMWVPLDIIKNSPLYDPSQRKRVKGTERKSDYGGGDQKWVLVHEWYDKLNSLMYTSVLEEDMILRCVPYNGIIPYDFIAFNMVPSQFMPLPDAALVYPHAVELDLLSQRMSGLMDRQRVQMLYDGGMITESEQLTAFLAGDDGAKVPVKVDRAMGEKLSDATFFPQAPEIPQSMYQHMMNVRDEVRNASGITNTRSGAGREGRMTATETRAREQGTDIRFADKTLALEHFLERLGGKVLALVRDNWDVNLTALVSGERDNDAEVRQYNAAREEILSMGKDDEIDRLGPPPMPKFTIRGQFIVKVRPGSTTPQDKMAEFQKDMVILQTGLADPQVDNQKISKWFFKKHGPEEAVDWFPPDEQAGLLSGMGTFAPAGGPSNPMAQPQQPEAVNPQDEGQLFGDVE